MWKVGLLFETLKDMKSPAEIQVLVVDDDIDLLDMIKDLFSGYGFTVFAALNGVAALKFIDENKIDIVLTDIRMPQMYGVELLKNLRERDRNHPCVLMTSGYADVSAAELFSFGANGFFQKPFNLAAVRDSLYKALLTKDDQWKIKQAGNFEHKIGRPFADFNELTKSDMVKFGNGGFFFQQKNPTAKVNEGVSFKFKFDDSTFLDKMEGTGIVRWVKIIDSPQNSAGIGIEIKSLSDGCRSKVCAWLDEQSFKSFIPLV